MARRTKITIETESLLVLRGQNARRAWCPTCAAEVEVIALEEVGLISNLEQSALEEWFNAANLHRTQAVEGAVLICLPSLLGGVVQKTKTT